MTRLEINLEQVQNKYVYSYLCIDNIYIESCTRILLSLATTGWSRLVFLAKVDALCSWLCGSGWLAFREFFSWKRRNNKLLNRSWNYCISKKITTKFLAVTLTSHNHLLVTLLFLKLATFPLFKISRLVIIWQRVVHPWKYWRNVPSVKELFWFTQAIFWPHADTTHPLARGVFNMTP